MSQVNDEILRATTDPTEQQTVNDGLFAYFSLEGGSTLQDAEALWLDSKLGIGPGTNQDRWNEYLDGLGYEGSRVDKHLQFWIDQPDFGSFVFPVTNLQGVGTFPPAEADLTWDAPVGGTFAIANYEVYRDDVLIDTIAGNLLAYNDPGVASDLAFKYELLTIDVQGFKSDLSVHTNVAIPNLVLWDEPTAVIFDLIAINLLQIDWTAPVGPPGSFPIATYNVYRNGAFVAATPDTSTSIDVNTADGVAEWAVAVVDSDGNEGTLSPGDNFDATPIPLTAPTGLVAVQSVDSLTVQLNWNAVVQGGSSFPVDHYEIFRDGQPIGENVAPNFLDPNPTQVGNTVHLYQVRAVDDQSINGLTSDVSLTMRQFVLDIKIFMNGRASSFTKAQDFVMFDISDVALIFDTDFEFVSERDIIWTQNQIDEFLAGLTDPGDSPVAVNGDGDINVITLGVDVTTIKELTIQGRPGQDSTQFRFTFVDNYGVELLETALISAFNGIVTLPINIDTTPP